MHAITPSLGSAGDMPARISALLGIAAPTTRPAFTRSIVESITPPPEHYLPR